MSAVVCALGVVGAVVFSSHRTGHCWSFVFVGGLCVCELRLHSATASTVTHVSLASREAQYCHTSFGCFSLGAVLSHKFRLYSVRGRIDTQVSRAFRTGTYSHPSFQRQVLAVCICVGLELLYAVGVYVRNGPIVRWHWFGTRTVCEPIAQRCGARCRNCRC